MRDRATMGEMGEKPKREPQAPLGLMTRILTRGNLERLKLTRDPRYYKRQITTPNKDKAGG